MRRIGGTGMRRRYGGWRWIGRGKLPRAPKSSACAHHRLLPAWDPSAPSPVGDEAVQWSRSRLFHIGARDKAIASRRDDAPVSLSAELGGFLKKGHHRDEKKTPVVRALIKQLRLGLDSQESRHYH
jgi:hypothetical protein